MTQTLQFLPNDKCRLRQQVSCLVIGLFVFIIYAVIGCKYFSTDKPFQFPFYSLETDPKVHEESRMQQKCMRFDTLDPREVPVNQAIFFIETNMRDTVELTPRQACSVESAARVNPGLLVYVLFLSPRFECQKDTTAAFSLLENYHNVRYRHIDLSTYVLDTPFDDFVHSGVMNKGRWPVEQHSDMLRILTLWKFGGIYMDLDMISLKPMPLTNFFGAEYPEGTFLASSVLGIQDKNIAERAIEMFKDGWDGNNWTKNGPFLITRLIKELCKTDNIISLYSGSADCGNISIYPPDTFGPIPWFKWKFFFDPTKNEFVTEKMKKSLAVHFWNKLSKINPVIPNSNQPYANIASKSCPKVFRTVIDNF